MKLAKVLQNATFATALMALMVSPVMADGDQQETKTTEKEVCVTQYGGGTECTKETITEEVIRRDVTHETVDAGLEDFKYLPFAGMLAGIGITFLVLSKITQKVYVLDN